MSDKTKCLECGKETYDDYLGHDPVYGTVMEVWCQKCNKKWWETTENGYHWNTHTEKPVPTP